jgi:hypothetical protein
MPARAGKILRTGSQASSARKPMIAFADPYSPRPPARSTRRTSELTFVLTGTTRG